MSTPHVIIVGGGLAGLAASVELARRGAAVTIVERNAHLGGKMNVLSERGFTFDMGPTILTMPQVVRGIFERTGRPIEQYIDLLRLDPQWRCFYEDGTVLDLADGVEPMAAALDRQFPGSGAGKGWREFLAFSRRMFRLSEKVFFYKDLGGISDLMWKPPREKGVLPDVLAMRLYSTVAATVHRSIREPHVRQLAEHFLQYVGSSPFLAPAILSLIAAAQADHGCWYAMGGTRTVAQGLSRLGAELGVGQRLGAGVRRIETRDGRVVGVELQNGERIAADVVVSNCDVQRTYRDLLGGGEGGASSSVTRQHRSIASTWTPACSGVVLYMGLDRQYDHLAHHCFMFSRDSAEEFDDIYRKGIPARDPTIYLAVPSRSDPAQAPPGGEALYALIHTPYLRPGQRWEGPGGLLEQYRPTIVAKLERMGLENLSKHILFERSLTPASIERLYNAEGGAIYGLASHGRLRGGFKPRNRSKAIRGLYFAGGSANPGPGVPMVLMSGVTAADAVAEDCSLRGPASSGGSSGSGQGGRASERTEGYREVVAAMVTPGSAMGELTSSPP